MPSLGEDLCNHSQELVELWYQAWRRSAHPHPGVTEAKLKNLLASQLTLIGEQLQQLSTATRTDSLWTITERLDPEKRVSEEIPIEDVVHQYGMVVKVVRNWIEERRIEVPFLEYSYFHQAIFELIAESVRRYALYQAGSVTKARGQYLAGIAH
jgi:two-component system sensor histidine kinase SenX3